MLFTFSSLGFDGKPKVIMEPRFGLSLGQSVNLTCNGQNLNTIGRCPPILVPTYEFFKESSSIYSGHEPNYVIANLTYGDIGSYDCQVKYTSAHTRHSESVTIFIAGKSFIDYFQVRLMQYLLPTSFQ